MKKYIKAILGTVITLFLASVFLGKDFVKSHLGTLLEEGKSLISQTAGAEYELRRMKGLIHAISQKVFEFEDRMDELAGKAKTLQEEVTDLNYRIESDLADLRLERDHLRNDLDTYEIRGSKYSRKQVMDSASARADRIESNRRILEVKTQGLALLEQAILEGRANLAKAQTIREEHFAKLNQLETEMQVALNNKEVYEMIQPISGDSLVAATSELAQSFQNYEKRIDKVEREGKIRLPSQENSKVLNHSTNGESPLISRLDNTLGDTSKSTVVLNR